jgi:tRNA (guanine9-N1)-methyltransferase
MDDFTLLEESDLAQLDDADGDDVQAHETSSAHRLSKQEKKSAKFEHRKEKLKERKGNAKMKLKDRLKHVSHEEKLAFSAAKKHNKQRKADNAINAMNSDVKVCIDLSFNDANSPREQRSLVKQCTLSYAAIRNSAHGVALHLSSLEGDIGASLREQGVEQWHVRRHAAPACDVFGRQNIVVLSPDAEDILDEFDPTKVYIVGGIVDRTVRNNLTRDRARAQGVACQRLPVKECFPQAQSHVINIDQVVSLFCHYQETKNWQVS